MIFIKKKKKKIYIVNEPNAMHASGLVEDCSVAGRLEKKRHYGLLSTTSSNHFSRLASDYYRHQIFIYRKAGVLNSYNVAAM